MSKQEERPQQQNEKRGSSVDRANQIYNNALRLRRIYKKAKWIRRGVQIGRAAAIAVSTSEIWVPIVVILLLVFIVAVAIIVIFSGTPPPTCETITAESNTTSQSSPDIITLNNCSSNTIFSWSDGGINGVFSPTNGQSTTYTPPALSTTTPVTITANICSATNTSRCTQLSLGLTITTPTCGDFGGSCANSSACHQFGIGTYPGGTPDCQKSNGAGSVCCNYGGSIKFYCQYGTVNSSGNIVSAGTWNYTYNGNQFCSISSGYYHGSFIGSKGCAPTSIAMALSSLGYAINPKQVSQQNPSYSNSARNIGCEDPGTTTSDMTYGVRRWVNSFPGTYSMTGNLIYSGMTLGVLNTMNTYINRGCYIVAGGTIDAAQNSGWTGFIGHAFLISGVDVANRSLTVYDPTFCEGPGRNTGGKRTLTNVTSTGTSTSSNQGFFNAYAICK